MDITGPAKKLAQENKIDYKKIKGTGKNGKVLIGDIKRHMKTKKVSPKTSKSPAKTKKKSKSPKWNVKVSVIPYVENNPIADIPIIQDNTKEFEKWIIKKLPLINTTFSNIKTKISDLETIEIEFTITSKKNKEQLSQEIKEMLNINDHTYSIDVKFSGKITFVDDKERYERSPQSIPDDTEANFQEVKFKNIQILKLKKI